MIQIFITCLSVQGIKEVQRFYWSEIADLLAKYRTTYDGEQSFLLDYLRNIHKLIQDSRQLSTNEIETVFDFSRALELGKRNLATSSLGDLETFLSLPAKARDEIILLILGIFLLTGDLRLLNSLMKVKTILPYIFSASKEREFQSLIDNILLIICRAESY